MESIENTEAIEENGLCHDPELFYKLWEDNPQAPFRLRVRNFVILNRNRSLITLELAEFPWEKVHCEDCDLTHFFPDTLAVLTALADPERKTLAWKVFHDNGQDIATETGRPFMLHRIHRSSDQHEMEHEYYGPWSP